MGVRRWAWGGPAGEAGQELQYLHGTCSSALSPAFPRLCCN